MERIFVAYATGNGFQRKVIEDAALQASGPMRKIEPWSQFDASGDPIQQSVEEWIKGADSFVADISVPNCNVTYELGFAIARQMPFRLIRSKQFDLDDVRQIGLIDTLAHDSYDYAPSLTSIFKNNIPKNRWEFPTRDGQQPIFVLQPPRPMDWSQKTVSAIKKVAKLRFRNFNPAEINRLNAREAFEDVARSFGVVCFWLDETTPEAVKHNQRTSFAFGLARGSQIPSLLIAHQSSELPLDLHDIANRYDHLDQIDDLVADFREDILEEQMSHTDPVATGNGAALNRVSFGEPVAENEQAALGDFFLETEAYTRALHGQSNVLIGRKGSGKSAIFFQVRNVSRANKQNIVVDLMPEGYSLIKLKEYVLDNTGYGTKKEIISAFWQYVIWLEIAYKILEKDGWRAKRDPQTMPRYRKLEEAFLARVDTGKGDFSERLQKLSDNIIQRFASEIGSAEVDALRSSKILEIIHGHGIREIREQILEYLEIKGFVFFLFDNLDRFWTPGGFDEDDALILIGLAEAMQEIERKFRKDDKEFRWALFLRSDVYEFLVAGMADYGKLSTRSLEWSDPEQLKALFKLRLLSSDGVVKFNDISDSHVFGRPVLDALASASLMRPRYLIRLADTARRRALTLGRPKITEADYKFALKELGWQVLEDLDRETQDLVPDSAELLFELLANREDLDVEKLRYVAMKSVKEKDQVETLIDVLIWSGALGVVDGGVVKFIYDCGYKRQYLGSLIRNNPSISLVIHPTLCATAEN